MPCYNYKLFEQFLHWTSTGPKLLSSMLRTGMMLELQRKHCSIVHIHYLNQVMLVLMILALRHSLVCFVNVEKIGTLDLPWHSSLPFVPKIPQLPNICLNVLLLVVDDGIVPYLRKGFRHFLMPTGLSSISYLYKSELLTVEIDVHVVLYVEYSKLH